MTNSEQGGVKTWLHQCHLCICEVAPSLNLTQNCGWTKKHFQWLLLLHCKVMFEPNKIGFRTSPLKYITPNLC